MLSPQGLAASHDEYDSLDEDQGRTGLCPNCGRRGGLDAAKTSAYASTGQKVADRGGEGFRLLEVGQVSGAFEFDQP